LNLPKNQYGRLIRHGRDSRDGPDFVNESGPSKYLGGVSMIWPMEKTAIMSVQYAQWTLEYFLQSMRQCGFSGVDFWAGAPHFAPEMFRCHGDAVAGLKRIRNRLDELNMWVACYTQEQINYPVNIASFDPIHRKISVEYFCRGIEYAQILNAPAVFITSGVGQRDIPKDVSMGYAIDSIKQVVKHAETNGMNLIIEQLQPFETNLGLRLHDIQGIVEAVNSPCLNVCVDVVAMAVAGETLDQYFDVFGPRIQLIHMADGNPGGHFVPGDGHLDIHGFFHTLTSRGFNGIVTWEVNSTRYLQDPHQALARTLAYMVQRGS
jgi:protein FrlC